MRLDFINASRGAAALGVLFFHGFGLIYSEGIQVHWLLLPISSLSKYGGHGVDVFFALSGFCIANLLVESGKDKNITWFFFDRFLRIYPPYWAAVIFSFLLFLASKPFNNSLGDVWSALPSLCNMLLIELFFGLNTYLLVAWTLNYEIFFYFILSFSMFVEKLRARVLFFLSCLFFVSNIFFCSVFPFDKLAEFSCGIFAYLILRNEPKDAVTKRSVSKDLTVASLIGLILIGVYYFMFFSLPHLVAFFYSLALILFSKIEFSKKNPLYIVGEFSYSLYLVHVFTGGRVINLCYRFVSFESIFYLFVFSLYLIVSLCSAYFFYLIFESYFNSIRKKILKKIC